MGDSERTSQQQASNESSRHMERQHFACDRSQGTGEGSRMTDKRAVAIIRRSLKRLIKQNSVEPSAQAGYRKCLKGGSLARSQATKKAREYLAVMAVEAPEVRVTPPALNNVLAELRESANNIRLHCTARIQNLEKLLRIAGFSCGVHHGDATDALIDSILGTTTPENRTPTVIKVRAGARNQALADIRAAFEQDRAAGLFRTLNDAQLRLPEQSPIAKSEQGLSEAQKSAIDAAIEAFRKAGGNNEKY